MIKFRLYYDKDEEEKFLNKMSQRGYELKKFFCGFFTFEKEEENGFTYRIDHVGGKSAEELEDYMEIIREAGAILVLRWGPWIILKKKGEFELYTDQSSKIKLYTRIRNMFIYFLIIEVGCAFSEINAFLASKNPIFIFFYTLILMIIVAFARQVRKCNKKIRMLKED